jgi:diguanylate cyclase
MLFAFDPDTFHRAMAFVSVMYIAASLRSIKTLGFFFGRAHRLAHELKREKARAEELARTDVLTSLANRRAFYEQAERLMGALAGNGRPASALMFDIDRFKAINDSHGHAGGDAAIRAVAAVIRDNRGESGVAARLGGEEFVLLLPGAPPAAAGAIAERVRMVVETLAVEHAGRRIGVTISAGVTALAAGEDLEDWLGRADAALYRAKDSGRNCVVVD